MKKNIALFGLIGILMLIAIQTSAQIAVSSNNLPADPSAGLDVRFNNKGFLPPRMTLQQRDAIVNPANGLMVVCTDCGTIGALCMFLSGNWVNVTLCNPPAPQAGTHDPTGTQIIWHWNAAPNATGYKPRAAYIPGMSGHTTIAVFLRPLPSYRRCSIPE